MGIQEPPGALQCLLWTASCPGLWARRLWARLREGGSGPGLGVSWAERLGAEGDQVLGDRAWVHGRSGKVRSPAPLPAAGSTSVRPSAVAWPLGGLVAPGFLSLLHRLPGWISPGGTKAPWVSPWVPPLSPGLAQASGPVPYYPRLFLLALHWGGKVPVLQAGVTAGWVPSRNHKKAPASPLSSQVGWSRQTLDMWPRPQGQSLAGCPGDQKGGWGPERGCQGPGAQPVG